MRNKILIVITIICCLALIGGGIKLKLQNESLGIDEDGNPIPDWLSVEEVDNKEFYVMNVDGGYLEIPGECKWINFESQGDCLDLENGQVAHVIADVKLYYGGEEGFSGDIFIKTIKSCEIMDYERVVNELSIPKLYQNEFDYNNRLLSYKDKDGTYLIVYNRRYNYIFKEGELLFKEENSSGYYNLDSVYEKLIKH